MARKRSPENDYICMMCHCPTEPPGLRISDGRPPVHLGGGSVDMRACKRARPILRSEFEAMVARDVAAIRHSLARPR